MEPGLGTRAAALLTVLLVLAGCGAGAASTPQAAPTTTSPSSTPSHAAEHGFQPKREDFLAVSRVLGRRAAAVRAHHWPAFRATVDTSDQKLLAGQRVLYDNLTGLSLASFHYEMDTTAALVPGPVAGHDPVLHPAITEFVQLGGSLAAPVTNGIDETFVRRGHRWLLGSEGNDTTSDVQWRPWGGPPISSLREDTMTVLVDRSRAATLPALAQSIHDDIAFDAGQLGVPASYTIVVDATTTGSSTSFSSLSKEEAAAVTFGLVAGTRNSPAVGGRAAGLAIKVNPKYAGDYAQSTPLLRHELTHYLLCQYNGAAPIWLSEGIATWIQYYPDSFSRLVVPSTLYTRLMAAPRSLPSIGLFNEDPDINYVVSQAAVTWLVSHYGMPRLIELMRAYREHFSGANADALTTSLLRQVYGLTQQQVVTGAFGLIASFQH